MLPRRQKQQRVVVSCLVEHDGQVLLLRGSQVSDEASRHRMGYFNLPRFTVPFGADPDELLRTTFAEYFDQALEDVAVFDIVHRLADMGYTQEVEILYRAKAPQVTERPGKYQFVAKEDLAQYMFAREYERILREVLGE